MYKQVFSFLQLFLCAFAVLIFISGFIQFNTFKDIKKSKKYFDKSTINKVVFIIIDALRYDMIEENTIFNEFKDGIYSNNVYKTKVLLQTPSVTMPRIKTITSGDISTFVDIILNLKSSEINDDNIIDILIKFKNFRIDFYGDETWLKLFPNRFRKVDGTTSFFVKDYVEVDRNVSRNIPQILNEIDQWDMVIMHYLGLDHIGHVEGPFSKMIDGKLMEMKNNILKMLQGIDYSKNLESTLFIVTGDHGMSDLGGHGGASLKELTTSIMFFNNKFRDKSFNIFHQDHIYQNDISTSISLLTGVPIPINSVGVIPYELLSLIEKLSDQSKVLYSNFNNFMNKNLENFDKFYIPFQKIQNNLEELHLKCESTNDTKAFESAIIEEHIDLIKLLRSIQTNLISRKSSFNTLFMEIGLILLSATFINYVLQTFHLTDQSTLHYVKFGTVILSKFLISLVFSENVCQYPIYSSIKCSLIFLEFILILIFGFKWKNSIMRIFKLSIYIDEDTKSFLFFIPFLNFLSNFSSSFIEEEHQIWYFLSTTFFLLQAVNIFKKNNHFNVGNNLWSFLIYISIPLMDRILRVLNQTGDKWAILLDFGDYLNKPEHFPYLLFFVLLSKCLIFLFLYSLSTVANMILIGFLLTSATYRSFLLMGYHESSYETSIYICYVILCQQIIAFIYCQCEKRWMIEIKWISRSMNHFRCIKLSNIFLLLMILLSRSHNIILLAGLVCKRSLLHRVWCNNLKYRSILEQAIMFHMFGMVSFFHQGNSNSITTIDIRAGYTGLKSYQPIIIGVLLFLHTFGGHIFWILVWFEWFSEAKDSFNKRNEDEEKYSSVLTSLSFLSCCSLLSSAIICSLLKYHLFVWSVFTPRLIYCTLFSVILIPFYFVVSVIYF